LQKSGALLLMVRLRKKVHQMIPDDITPIILEIDNELKAEGVKAQGRPMQAVIKFGQRFKLSMVFAKPSFFVSDEVNGSWKYTEKIFVWYKEVYGDQTKVDPSANARIVVLADCDLWELRLPIIFGNCKVYADRKLSNDDGKSALGPPVLNACDTLTGLRQARLDNFSDEDLDEVFSQFQIGMNVRQAFDRFQKSNNLFRESQSDMATAVMHLTAQIPNYGQSRWASLQFAEKFMKGLLREKSVPFPGTHKLSKLHDILETSIPSLDLKFLLPDIECTAGVRYGDEQSTRDQAYIAHKSSLSLIRALGSA
jgi:hypothetical protein